MGEISKKEDFLAAKKEAEERRKTEALAELHIVVWVTKDGHMVTSAALENSNDSLESKAALAVFSPIAKQIMNVTIKTLEHITGDMNGDVTKAMGNLPEYVSELQARKAEDERRTNEWPEAIGED